MTTVSDAADVVVRRARFGDLRAVALLQRRAFPKLLAYHLPALTFLKLVPGVAFLVAVIDDTIVGNAIGDYQGDKSRLINIAVDPDRQGQGIGTTLLREINRALPYADLVLLVQAENERAARLYTREGFVPDGPAPDYYGKGRDGVWMRKRR